MGPFQKQRRGTRSTTTLLILLLSLLLSLSRTVCDAILQTAELDVYLLQEAAEDNAAAAASLINSMSPSYSFLASQASFGSYPSMTKRENPVWTVVLPPTEDALLCNNYSDTSVPVARFAENTAVLAPRGTCTFEKKAWNAQRLGAAAILVHGTLASRYSYNATSRTIDYPQEYYDYDCQKGQALIPKQMLQLQTGNGYDGEYNDPLLQGTDASKNLCLKYDHGEDDSSSSGSHTMNSCDSKACLLTGKNTTSGDVLQACCAWDLHVWLYSDGTFQDGPTFRNITNRREVTIPAVYLTIRQGNQLIKDISQHGSKKIQIVLSERWRQLEWNPSSFFIWALGVTVAAAAAYLSADDYHSYYRKLFQRQQRQQAQQQQSSSRQQQRQQHPPPPQPTSSFAEESMELTAAHALGFVVMASTSLLVLFYFKIYAVVKVFYALGCSKAVSQVFMFPLFSQIFSRCFRMNPYQVVWKTNTQDFGDLTLVDIVSHVAGYALGITWLICAFKVRHAEAIPFFWMTQNLFGTAMCIMFLQVIKLNSIRVAAILLLVAFFYDIFFVFITPLLFHGKSVMITVATSGGPPKADPAWCEKYPDDANCQGGEPLPMLLTVPRINDYMGGSSLLGLGDIVLPGLLLSFGARFDAAKMLLGILGGGTGMLHSYQSCPERKFCWHCKLCSGGYFFPLVIAYAIGLFMANAAVYLMNMGQPALLYLVPCCLGTMVFMGWRRGELKDLWDGPKAIRVADDVVYGIPGSPSSSSSGSGHGGGGHDRLQAVPTAEDAADHPGNVAPPSAVDDDALLEQGGGRGSSLERN